MSDNNQKSEKTLSTSSEGVVNYPPIVGDSSQIQVTTMKFDRNNYLT